MANLQPPKSFQPGKNPAEAWEKWRQMIEIYWIAADLSQKSNKIQKAMFLHILGEEGIDLYNTFQFEFEQDEEGNPRNLDEVLTVEMILDAFSHHYTPFKNETYIRHLFFTANQVENQTVDDYVTELRMKVKDCGFEHLTESLIKDRIICGIRSNSLKEKLLKVGHLDLATCIQMCRAEEEAARQVDKMSRLTTEVFGIKQYGVRKGKDNAMKKQFVCSRCTFSHEFGNCSAMGQKCGRCGKMNHYSKACKAKLVNQVDVSLNQESSEDKDFVIGAVYKREINAIRNGLKEWTEEIIIGEEIIKFKLDTGSQANLLPNTIYKKLKETEEINKTNNQLISYTENVIEVKGICKLNCKIKNKYKDIEFYITTKNTQPLLGLESIEELNLLRKVNKIEIEGLKEEKTRYENFLQKYKDVFQGIGCANSEYTIRIQDNSEPSVARCRRIPRPLWDKVKEELDKMEKDKIIEKSDEFTEWVHPIVVVLKPDQNVRVCMDPRPLNKFIKRENVHMPTIESVLADIAESKYFTVLDARSAFHQIPLDKASSKLCTITTPFGKYRYKRLPYGLSCSSEAFQKEMNKIVAEISGVVVYADDILIHGKTLKEHNDRLENVLKQAKKCNIKFKEDKTQLAVEKIKYLGYWITKEGIEICKEKTDAIVDIEVPNNKKDLQTFLGMVNYLSKFIPNMSKETAPLRHLLKTDSEWIWDENKDDCFTKLKSLICNAPVLKNFDDKKDIEIATDASKEAVGGVLLQDNYPVAYCSASLNEAQSRYSVIEKELLAIVLACEHYHYYIYGRNEITIHTDHKPLIGLVNKPIDDLSPRLQSLVIRLMKYSVRLEYHPGKTMYIPDALSRLKRNNKKFILGSLAEYKVQSVVVASKKRIEELKEETLNDSELKQVVYYIRNGWPCKVSGAAKEAKPYFNTRHELFEHNGFVFKNKQLVVPKALRAEMLERIHLGHMGINSCTRRAQEAIYWPNMTNDINDFVSTCLVCQRQARNNVKEPFQCIPTANYPWECIAMDFFKATGQEFLLITDYYSKFTIIEPLRTTTASSVIAALKRIFAHHGLPTKIRSDNGPPFSAEEFQNYLKSEEIRHKTSSPHYPQANGLIERHIQTIKNMILKSPEEDIFKLVMVYNNTPKSNLPAPTQIFMNRRIRTNLPIKEEALQCERGNLNVQNKLQRNQDNQAKYYNRYTKERSPLNENVLLKKGERNWIPAKVVQEATGYPNSYWIQTEDGATYRRNKFHLKNLRTKEIADEQNIEVPKVEENEKVECQQKTKEIEANKNVLRRSKRELKMPCKFQDFVVPQNLPMGGRVTSADVNITGNEP